MTQQQATANRWFLYQQRIDTEHPVPHPLDFWTPGRGAEAALRDAGLEGQFSIEPAPYLSLGEGECIPHLPEKGETVGRFFDDLCEFISSGSEDLPCTWEVNGQGRVRFIRTTIE